MVVVQSKLDCAIAPIYIFLNKSPCTMLGLF
jgi:hypothetical protein